MNEINLKEALLKKVSSDEDWLQWLKAKLSGRPFTEVIKGELMVYLKNNDPTRE